MTGPREPRLALVRGLLEGLLVAGRTRVTSRELARWVGTTPDTVRKDLSSVPGGTPGAAYDVLELLDRVRRIAAPPSASGAALAGLGDFGLGLAGWAFAVGFDARPNRLETVEVPYPVYPTTEIVPVCVRLGIETAVLTVGAGEAQRVAERFVQGGVRRLINYTPTVLRVDRHRIEVCEWGSRG